MGKWTDVIPVVFREVDGWGATLDACAIDEDVDIVVEEGESAVDDSAELAKVGHVTLDKRVLGPRRLGVEGAKSTEGGDLGWIVPRAHDQAH